MNTWFLEVDGPLAGLLPPCHSVVKTPIHLLVLFSLAVDAEVDAGSFDSQSHECMPISTALT